MAQLWNFQDLGNVQATKGVDVDGRLLGGDDDLLAGERGCSSRLSFSERLGNECFSPFSLKLTSRWT